ncbi:hypothetical protein TMatcc_000863 [Talaromyces marneffei ATCC 18224]
MSTVHPKSPEISSLLLVARCQSVYLAIVILFVLCPGGGDFSLLTTNTSLSLLLFHSKLLQPSTVLPSLPISCPAYFEKSSVPESKFLTTTLFSSTRLSTSHKSKVTSSFSLLKASFSLRPSIPPQPSFDRVTPIPSSYSKLT